MNICHNPQGTRPTAMALVKAIEFYMARGHEVYAFLPEWAHGGGKSGSCAIDSARKLDKYVFEGTVNLSPAHCDDDCFAIKFAQSKESGRKVTMVTNDEYEDHIRRGTITRRWRDQHVVKYMFVGYDFVPAKI